MKTVYPVIFTKTNDEKDTYLVDIPDIKGMTEGYGLADAIEMARDYIAGYCCELPDDEIPKASAAGDINVSDGMFADEGESFISLVDTDLDSYRRKMEKRAVRRNVSIPRWLDKEAEKAQLNFSRVLQEALMQKLNIE